jgi:hypothetical protein
MRNDQQIHGALSPSLIIQAQKSMLEQCRSARLSQSILVQFRGLTWVFTDSKFDDTMVAVMLQTAPS